MTANQTSLRASAGVDRHALIERRLRRYSAAVQPRVRALAAGHPRLADLALSFPPLLFALALPRPGDDPARAIACAIRGRPLGEVAAAAGIPWWLRRLPVDGLTRPLPALPGGEPFSRRIVNHFPRVAKLTAAWLETVSRAAQWGSEPFAVWIAREIARNSTTPKTGTLRLLALWAWFSQQPDTDGYRLMETSWRFEMQSDAAISAAQAWLDRLVLELKLGKERVPDLWLRPGPFDGCEFVPLDSAESLIEEAVAMENCVRTYAGKIVANRCRLWSIRREGQRIATLEVRRNREHPLLHIAQLTSARNEKAPIEVWWLATRWLHQHDLMSIRPEPRVGGPPFDGAAWRKLWRPYWLAKRRFPAWLPLAPSWVINALY